MIIDESDRNKEDTFYRKLSSDEERDRYNFLKEIGPTEIKLYPFTEGFEYKKFKHYSVFIYDNLGISIIEGFNYGDACYILGVKNIKGNKNYYFS